jgi:tetratricopeptide (TPR) repeat protein
MLKTKRDFLAILLIAAVGCAMAGTAPAQTSSGQRPIEMRDILGWKTINFSAASVDGSWFAYRLAPAEGNSEVVFKQLKGEKEYRFPIGESPRGMADIAFSEDAAWAAYQLGELEFGRGDVRPAAAWYRRGLELAPSYIPNLAGLAKVAWARGDDDLAIRRYKQVVAAYPAVEYVTALGDLYASSGREYLAAQQYAVVDATRAIARANGVNVDLEVALFDADHGRPRSALSAARAEWSRRRSIHVADAYAWALHAVGSDEAAAGMMRRALRLGTRNALFLFHAGMIQRALGHEAAARRDLREALVTNPHFSILHASTTRRVLAGLEAAR